MWSSYRGGDGDGPSPEEVQAWQRRFQPPENEVPVVVPTAAVLGRTADLAVVLTGARVHSTGVALDVAVRLRTESQGRAGGDLFDLIGGHGHRWGEDVDVDRLLLLGVEFPDGRRASTLQAAAWRGPGGGPDDPEAPTLVPTGGGGGGRSFDQGYWLHPLPPTGPLAVVCSWRAFGIPEGRVVLGSTAIADAASRVEVLWPEEPPATEPLEPPEPPAPSSGWFADAVRRRSR